MIAAVLEGTNKWDKAEPRFLIHLAPDELVIQYFVYAAAQEKRNEAKNSKHSIRPSLTMIIQYFWEIVNHVIYT